MSAGNRCDCCCECEAFCTGGYCGKNMNFVGTTSGASAGSSGNCAGSGNAADCAFVLDAAFNYTFLGSGTAEDWNVSFKPSSAAFDAKAGTKVCRYQSSDSVGNVCGGGATTSLSGGVLHIYRGTDDKYHVAVAMPYEESTGYSATLGEDAEFDGGGAAMDCGTPGEMSPTFSLSGTLAVYDETGSPGVECNPPTGFLLEGDPQ